MRLLLAGRRARADATIIEMAVAGHFPFAYTVPMLRTRFHPADLAVIILFGAIAACSAGLVLLLLLSALVSDPEYIMLVPVFVGPSAGAAGVILMTWFRHRLRIAWIPLFIASFLWFSGATLFAFTGFAALDFDEPSRFLPNLGYSLGLCLVPGVILAGMGVLMYWSDAVRNRPQHTDVEALKQQQHNQRQS